MTVWPPTVRVISVRWLPPPPSLRQRSGRPGKETRRRPRAIRLAAGGSALPHGDQKALLEKLMAAEADSWDKLELAQRIVVIFRARDASPRRNQSADTRV